MTNQNHTADTLAALPDDELDALAAKARGWTLAFGNIEVLLRNGETEMVREHHYEGIDDDGEVGAIVAACDWDPTRDANQALALLNWAIKRGWRFAIEADRDGSMIDFVQMDQVLWHWQRVDGFTPRAITIAFILAMQEVHNG